MILYFLFKALRFVVRAFPPRFTYVLGAVLAEVFYLFARRNRCNLQANIRQVMRFAGEEVSSRPVRVRIRRIARKNFRNFAYYLIDFFRFSRFAREDIETLIEVKGRENLNLALRGDKGAIGVTAHLGNWELGAIVLSLLGYRVNAVVFSHANTKLNNLFVQQRALGGVKVIPVSRAAARSLQVLRRGEILLIAADRDFTGKGEKVEFFGKPAVFPRGAAAFASRTGAGIFFGSLVREGTHSYSFDLNPPIETDRSLPGPEREAAIRKELVRQMQDCIARHLDQWFVYYRIWPEAGRG